MKKIAIIVILLVILVVGFVIGFWPKEESLATKLYIKDSGLTDRNFNDYVTSNPGRNVFFFCSYKNDSCNYVNNTVLRDLAENLLVDELDNIIFVDLSNASTTAVAKLKRQWGFSQYPAFAIIDSTSTGYKVVSALGFSQDQPFDSSDLKNWLVENGIWHVWLGLKPPPSKPEPKPEPEPDPFPSEPPEEKPTTKPTTKPTPDPDPEPPNPDPDPDPGTDSGGE